MKCPNCDEITDDSVCAQCGTTVLSDPEDKMEQLIEQASIPSLASLFKEGKRRGLIEAGKEYGQAN